MGSVVLMAAAPMWMVGVTKAQTAPQGQPSTPGQREAEIQALRLQLAAIAERLNALEAEEHAEPATKAAPAPATAAPPAMPAAAEARAAATAALSAEDEKTLSLFRSTKVGVTVDGYYDYNFNEPVGGVNLLRAYDVTANSFSINQADLVLERLPQPASRFGGRIDLMFGQATETLGGSGANETRPQVWRNLFQAYGSYLAPVGSGLQLDFGKFASSLGNEGNYTKDQIAYSRGYLYDYLPAYHTGLRASYTFSPKAAMQYLLVNGTQQTEDFNSFKSQAFFFTFTPARPVTWTVNYYFGQDGREYVQGPGSLPATQPGLPTMNAAPTPNGRQHIFDTYVNWLATPKLKLVGEGDYVVSRTYAEQQPGRAAFGAFELQYALPGDAHVGGRAEYFDDRSGLFSGQSQALKEVTLVADRLLAPGFLMRAEYRRDFSNRQFFLTDRAGALAQAQTTATMGLVFWWGTKEGNW